jgi:hypothetical protein
MAGVVTPTLAPAMNLICVFARLLTSAPGAPACAALPLVGVEINQ